MTLSPLLSTHLDLPPSLLPSPSPRQPAAMRSTSLRLLSALAPVRLTGAVSAPSAMGAPPSSGLAPMILLGGGPLPGSQTPQGLVPSPPSLPSPSLSRSFATAAKSKGSSDKNNSSDKRPLSGYMRFAQQERPKVLADNPGISFADVGKVLGERWRSLSDDQKKPFNEAYEAEKKIYEKQHPKV